MLTMDDKETKPIMDSYVTPLVISTAGIICSTLAIAVYHCILLRYVSRPQRTQQINNADRSHEKNDGVQEEVLNKIPIFSISAQTTLDVLHLNHNECSICLGLFEERDEVRLLPSCNHCFHRPCIDAWFMDHANCPVCRSPITCDCELASPIPSQNVSAQQRVLHVPFNIPSRHHHHHPFINHDVSGSTSRFQRPRPVLFHSFSLSSHMRQKPRALNMGLKRSLSLDQSSSYIAITIQRDEEETSTSSTKRVMMSEYNYRSRSPRHVDLMPWVFTRSFSQFRNGASGRYNGILPN